MPETENMEPGADGRDGGTFENLEVWREAMELAVSIYGQFRHCRDLEFRRQIQGAAVSVSSNIAEGYERDSNAEFIRFLFIAKGSCGEVRSQVELAGRLGLVPLASASALGERARRLSRRLQKLIDVRRLRFG